MDIEINLEKNIESEIERKIISNTFNLLDCFLGSIYSNGDLQKLSSFFSNVKTSFYIEDIKEAHLIHFRCGVFDVCFHIRDEDLKVLKKERPLYSDGGAFREDIYNHICFFLNDKLQDILSLFLKVCDLKQSFCDDKPKHFSDIIGYKKFIDFSAEDETTGERK